MFYEIAEILAIILFFVALFGLVTSKGVIKGIVSIIVMEVAVVMFFLSIGFRAGISPPIGVNLGENVADPLPQALMITAIIIGVAATAVNMTMLIALSRQFKTTEWDILRRKNME